MLVWMGICLQMPGTGFPKEHNIASKQPLHSTICEFPKINLFIYLFI